MADGDELYERQLNAIESLVSFHPEYLKALTREEQHVFQQYFLPDWGRVEDFRTYRQQLLARDPTIEERATSVLRKFLQAHDVTHGDDLLPSDR